MGYWVDYNLPCLVLSTMLIIQQIQYYGLGNAVLTTDDTFYHCSGGNYTTNGTYHFNLKLLLSSLTSKRTPIKTNRYYNNTVGRNTNDVVYGSFQCKVDAPPEICQDCVDRAAKQIIRNDRCPNSKRAYIWYDLCVLKYSDQYFFSAMQVNPISILWDPNNVTNPDQFDGILVGFINDLIKEAVSRSPSIGLFATGERTTTRDDENIYGLVQCTSDISLNSCDMCLRVSIFKVMRCCYGKQGGRVTGPSCYFRYEKYRFYLGDYQTPIPEMPILKNSKGGSSSMKLVVITIIPSVITGLSIIMIIIWYYIRKRKATKQFNKDFFDIQGAESSQFDFSTIKAATDNFADANKLGRGGFGSVYKGTLSDGQEIAVKRLSRNSGQGDKEFKNEAVLVIKLQHRNLTRLLGFCIHGEERLLIYEFMPNASLDQFIFDPIKRTHLGWDKRYKIIRGIARGLLYLHEDSRLRIVHRDVKASNVLLEADMNPKISDFGMARSFMVDQSQDCTKRIVGTYGYMAPEYAKHGHFSVKSDVFSFGVLVLEILTGRRNNTFGESEGVQDLLCYAWRHWKEGTALELLDQTLGEHYSRTEAMRCFQIGLLCVQEDIADRPTTASIINNFNNYTISLPSPSPPPGFCANCKKEPNMPSEENENVTVNVAPISELYPR